MQLISIENPIAPRFTPEERAQEALAGVIASVGEASFGREALASLNRWMPLCWWSIYRLLDDAPPAMFASGSFGVPDGTHASWRVYRASLYRRDATFSEARDHVQSADGAIVHWHAREMPARHREEIYSRHGLRERLSIVCRGDQHGLLAINFYRHESQAAFSDEDIDAVRSLARPLLACVKRHLTLSASAAMPADGPLESLTPREREVCERLLKGWTHEGIAADLGIAPATVKTYRDRAFDRLGIHHRNELFALVTASLRQAQAS